MPQHREKIIILEMKTFAPAQRKNDNFGDVYDIFAIPFDGTQRVSDKAAKL